MTSLARRTSRTMARRLGGALLGAAVLSGGLALTTRPAAAQMTVFDPRNYAQNLLTAARTLSQINNQVRSLQNEATMLLNQARNLSRVSFPELDALRQALEQVDQLMAEAQGVRFRVDGLDRQLRQLFPTDLNAALRTDEQVVAARGRLDIAMTAYRRTMGVQAQVVENVAADARMLEALVARSQGAEGGLQAQQTTNQLLALATKQQFQLQQLMSAQFRAQALELARRGQAEAEARAATKRFLGSGTAYTPQ
ncbi:P-type conjugative transfer protein TrbJ [Sphingomonas cannabina]|uniref:P-type conjugative transfer protein TrbJ n=1 Tax=Sphingomonas cannabina TaxID=2899123 RepID=UPI001F40E37C|nr:P-type conjugative transfer protein TrbJ [Sphingomonas cannabina]UIJ44746.1 P-type conjugative transfer protein TrbJ [Sphingomonas cannabina]